jgi:hypothetical protein
MPKIKEHKRETRKRGEAIIPPKFPARRGGSEKPPGGAGGGKKTLPARRTIAGTPRPAGEDPPGPPKEIR